LQEAAVAKLMLSTIIIINGKEKAPARGSLLLWIIAVHRPDLSD